MWLYTVRTLWNSTCECSHFGKALITALRVIVALYAQDLNPTSLLESNCCFVHTGLKSYFFTTWAINCFKCCYICWSWAVNCVSTCLYHYIPTQQVSCSGVYAFLHCIFTYLSFIMPRCAHAQARYTVVCLCVCLCVCVDWYNSCSVINEVQVRASIGF